MENKIKKEMLDEIMIELKKNGFKHTYKSGNYMFFVMIISVLHIIKKYWSKI